MVYLLCGQSTALTLSCREKKSGNEWVTSVKCMREVLEEEWNHVTIAEINKEIQRLPTVMEHCLNVHGGNNYNG
ncbi:hypothetical protein L873DRAFT_1683746 [Choiromyces venosus 120613-1]|uniref:Uncharacterized protein n=1 Tax=Choiromyces venosus 120613-1 TaxID=1336337 RepID=A0A3N4JMT8_9PEZI|nr:hypothetical protein L873DRAFT_1683746 [Choiromyces venosus 120613-1]